MDSVVTPTTASGWLRTGAEAEPTNEASTTVDTSVGGGAAPCSRNGCDRPRFVEEGHVHPFCGRSCAAAATGDRTVIDLTTVCQRSGCTKTTIGPAARYCGSDCDFRDQHRFLAEAAMVCPTPGCGKPRVSGASALCGPCLYVYEHRDQRATDVKIEDSDKDEPVNDSSVVDQIAVDNQARQRLQDLKQRMATLNEMPSQGHLARAASTQQPPQVSPLLAQELLAAETLLRQMEAVHRSSLTIGPLNDCGASGLNNIRTTHNAAARTVDPLAPFPDHLRSNQTRHDGAQAQSLQALMMQTSDLHHALMNAHHGQHVYPATGLGPVNTVPVDNAVQHTPHLHTQHAMTTIVPPVPAAGAATPANGTPTVDAETGANAASVTSAAAQVAGSDKGIPTQLMKYAADDEVKRMPLGKTPDTIGPIFTWIWSCPPAGGSAGATLADDVGGNLVVRTRFRKIIHCTCFSEPRQWERYFQRLGNSIHNDASLTSTDKIILLDSLSRLLNTCGAVVDKAQSASGVDPAVAQQQFYIGLRELYCEPEPLPDLGDEITHRLLSGITSGIVSAAVVTANAAASAATQATARADAAARAAAQARPTPKPATAPPPTPSPQQPRPQPAPANAPAPVPVPKHSNTKCSCCKVKGHGYRCHAARGHLASNFPAYRCENCSEHGHWSSECPASTPVAHAAQTARNNDALAMFVAGGGIASDIPDRG